MTASNGYAVFFFPQALEALGAAIAPYLQDSPAGPHVLCNEIDTAGALLEMTIQGLTEAGSSVQLELMVPTSMVRMIVSSQSDGVFGFGPRAVGPVIPDLPSLGPAVQADVATGTDAAAAEARKPVAKPADGKKKKANAAKKKSTPAVAPKPKSKSKPKSGSKRAKKRK